MSPPFDSSFIVYHPYVSIVYRLSHLWLKDQNGVVKHRDVEERGSIVRKEEEYNKRQQQHCARNSNGQQGSQQKETTENDYMAGDSFCPYQVLRWPW
jgi:hypothetical protein